MTQKRRFLKYIISNSQKATPSMPWERGDIRNEMIALRRALLDKPIRPQRQSA